MRGWIGVDFDGTLATYDAWESASAVGEPIGPMVERVKRWLGQGREVRIFTARIYPQTALVHPEWDSVELLRHLGGQWAQAGEAIVAIRAWSLLHIGQVLAITCVKDPGMIELYDDRCVQVHPNTGLLVGESTRNLE